MRRYCYFLFFIFYAALTAAAAPAINATLERDSISLGESTQLFVNYQDCVPTATPQIPAVPNAEIQAGGNSQRSEINNNQTTSIYSFVFVVHPNAIGEIVIPSFAIPSNRGMGHSLPLHLTVRPGEPLLQAANNGKAEAFLLLVAPENIVYVGQALPLILELYVKSGEDLHMPQFHADGFTISQPNRESQSRVIIGNTYYSVVVFKAAATPVKTGALTLGPAECNLVLRIRPAGGGDPLFSEFFGNYRRQEVNLTSQSVPVTVLPLPRENQPADFNGAIGRFSMTFSASPTNLNVGDPITLRLQISGRGSIETVPYPSQSGWTDFKLYPPTSSVQPSDPLGFAGAKTFEQVVIPTNAAVKGLPDISFSFFDPEKKQYQTLHQPPLPLVIHPVKSEPLPTPIASTNGTPQMSAPLDDIVHIKPLFGKFQWIGRPLVLRPWFLGLQAAPFAALLAAWLWRRRQDQLAANPRLRRKCELRQQTRHELQRIAEAAAANDAEQFYAAAYHLLQEHIGERLNLPSSAITEMTLEQLATLNAPPDLIQQIQQFFQMCDQARFAHSNATDELSPLVPQLQLLLERIQNLNSAQERRI